jgi:glycosyltransferase involved in cell wall biosynthesis
LTSTTINIIIPAYNEGLYIYNVVEEIVEVESTFDEDFRIIIVDDSSTDNTLEQIEKAKANFNNSDIICLKNQTNKGKGYSLRVGFEYCQPGLIIIQDADLEYSPSEYKKLVIPIIKNKTDVVYGSRFQGSEPKRVLYYTHYIANRWLTMISNIFTGLNLSDMETCYKVFKTELIPHIALKENRFGFEPEITAKLSRIKGIRFVEVGISYYGRTYSEGKKIKFSDALRAIWCIFKYNIWSKK